jgi:hypothetical protein
MSLKTQKTSLNLLRETKFETFLSLSMSLGTKRRDKGPCLSAALGHHTAKYTPTESRNMDAELDPEDFEIDIESANAASGVTLDNDDTPVIVFQKWLSFGKSSRSLPEHIKKRMKWLS